MTTPGANAASAPDRAPPAPARRAGPLRAAAWGAAVGYSALIAFTRPFTLWSEVLTALPLAAGAVLGVARSLDRRRPPGDPSLPGRWWPWLGLAVAVLVVELVELFASPRAAHPTLSSMLATVGSSHLGKGGVALAWLALGMWLLAP